MSDIKTRPVPGMPDYEFEYVPANGGMVELWYTGGARGRELRGSALLRGRDVSAVEQALLQELKAAKDMFEKI